MFTAMCGNILNIQCFTPLTESNIVCGCLIAPKYRLPFPHLTPGNSDTNYSLAIHIDSWWGGKCQLCDTVLGTGTNNRKIRCDYHTQETKRNRDTTQAY